MLFVDHFSMGYLIWLTQHPYFVENPLTLVVPGLKMKSTTSLMLFVICCYFLEISFFLVTFEPAEPQRCLAFNLLDHASSAPSALSPLPLPS